MRLSKPPRPFGAVGLWDGLNQEWSGDRARWGIAPIWLTPQIPMCSENLNVYLKKRPRFMTYALSILEEEAPRMLAGPQRSPWMQFEYAALDPAYFASLSAAERTFVSGPDG